MTLPFSAQLAGIRFCALRLHVENLLKELVRPIPLAVLQRHITPLDERNQVCAALAPDNNSLLHRLGRRDCSASVKHLCDAADQILHKAELTHVLRLQMRKFIRQVIGIHIPVCRDQNLFAAALFHKGKVAAPFIFYPDRMEVFRLRAEHDHDFCRVKRRKDIRLVLRAELILQRNARKENSDSLLYELVVQLGRQNRIGCPPAVVVSFLIADKDVERLFLLRYRENPFLNFIDRPGFLFIDFFLEAVGILQCIFIIRIIKDRCELCAVDRRNTPVRGWILHILDAVPA